MIRSALFLCLLLPVHDTYHDWQNQKGDECCADEDCYALDDNDIKEIGSDIFVRVSGRWCEVMPWMYLKQGKSPDWSHHHVCVMPPLRAPLFVEPCARLVCFQPKPSS